MNNFIRFISQSNQ